MQLSKILVVIVDTTVTTSPSEDEEDNAEFYDAQESDTFTLSIPGVPANNSRDRTDSQGSDDGSSSEGDQTPLPLSDAATTNSFRIVTDSTVVTPTTAANTDNLDNVSKLLLSIHCNYQALTISTYHFVFYLISCILY